MRIISLIASSTEIVCALGLQEKLVGRSHECDFPPGVKNLPVCSRPLIDVQTSSREIDQQVKTLVKSGSSVYQLDVDQLEALNPDVIITQDQCEVCAVSLNDVKKAACQLGERPPRIITLRTNSLDDLWQDIRKVAAALDVLDRGEDLIHRSLERLERITGKVKIISVRPAVLCLEWLDPLMAAGNWIPELIELLQGKNVLGSAGQLAPLMSWEDLRIKDPQFLITMPCGWDIPKTRQEIIPLTQMPGWEDLQAVQRDQVYLTDGNQYFNRPGPRLVESLEILAEILHPEIFNFGHQGKGWCRLSI